MKMCATCKHWDAKETKEPVYVRLRLGPCEAIQPPEEAFPEWPQESELDEKLEDVPLAMADTSCPMEGPGWLVTRGEFGCVLHEERKDDR